MQVEVVGKSELQAVSNLLGVSTHLLVQGILPNLQIYIQITYPTKMCIKFAPSFHKKSAN